MYAKPDFASVTRTAPIDSDDALRVAIDDLEVRLERHGRSMADIDLVAWGEPWHRAGADAYVDRVGQLAQLGATWTTVGIDRSSPGAAFDSLRGWGEARRALG
jgi:hypothetical protein